MTKIEINPDVHKALKVYQAQHGYPSLSEAINALLVVRDEANKTFLAAKAVVEEKLQPATHT